MEKRKIALYSSIITSDIIEKSNKIKEILSKKIIIEDFLIFTKDLMSYRPQHFSVFYDFYSTFYDGDIVFINNDDLIEKYDSIKDNKKNIYFYGIIDHDIPNYINYINLNDGEYNEKL